jgi:23S rRNA (uracil1939-C5)-methyltransferase
MLKLNDVITVKIENLASSGNGVAHFEDDTNRTIFVPFAVPGDELKVRIRNQNKVYFEAEILKVIKPSKDRQIPICPYFEECGGCDWLHIKYNKQLEEKEKLLKFYFSKHSIEIPKIKPIGATNPLYYRDKIRIKNGFYKRQSKETILVEECHIINKAFWRILEEVRENEECYGFDYEKNEITQFKAYYFYDDKLSSEKIKFAYLPKGFVQNNLVMNQVLIREVVDNTNKGSVLELYCGNGNFTIPISKKQDIKSVVAVEGNYKSHQLLLENIDIDRRRTNNENHLETNFMKIIPYHEDSKHFIKHTSKYNTIIMDPPRIGTDGVILDAAKLTKKIIYVSCDANIFAKEFKDLQKATNNAWKITSITLIDMFPQTKHFECVIVIEKI